MGYTYAYENPKGEGLACAHATNLKISLKKTVETTKAIRGRRLSAAQSFLEEVIRKERAVPYTRFKAEVAHKKGKGIDTGEYPVNVAKEVLRLLQAVEKNASEKDLSGELRIEAISAREGTGRFHTGRYPGRNMKVTHLEVVVKEMKKEKKSAKKEESKE